MFTGIVTDIGEIESLKPRGAGAAAPVAHFLPIRSGDDCRRRVESPATASA